MTKVSIPPRMNKTRLTINPILSDLHEGDTVLPEMVHVVRHLIQGKPELEVAANAALAYLALMTAFQQEGLLELEWVPELDIDVGNTEYKVVFSLK